ncbi:MAG TPA: hypothetical protein DGT21_06375 [Armatimonadetes bacterium]|nr:hypothetical protein [Armatimonadota bacterium]
MYCTGCGVENDDNARFCKGCGAELSIDQTVLLSPQDEPAQPPPSQPTAAQPAPVQAQPQPAAPAPARGGGNVALIVVLVALGLMLLVVIGVGGYLLGQRFGPPEEMPDTTVQMPTEETTPEMAPSPGESVKDGERGAVQPATDDADADTPDEETVSSDDAVAEARVVLEKYLAADLGHDGNEMARYLGGQAAARFVPEVQGQEDLVVHSKTITDYQFLNDYSIDFIVEVVWSPSDSSDTSTSSEDYVLRRTEKGWLIFSTPAYPEGE